MIEWILLVSRQGKLRLMKWFVTADEKTRARTVKEVTNLVLARKPKTCNFLELRDTKIIYRRYASLYFIVCTSPSDNELLCLEIVHRYVEVLDKYFGNVTELDLIFNFQQAYTVLDEVVVAGELVDSSKRAALRAIASVEAYEAETGTQENLREAGLG
ncbi:AP complex, mu/sigma subunit [Auriculariales sp. MPI-PUGE-AT-0066]|nr:AP complex, mu/sigma subunit [Auriculariales sp. MPI-PUGE-AT-0066]